MACICTHSLKSHENGERCTAIEGKKQCGCIKYRDGDTASQIADFDKQSELYQLLNKMEPLTKSIQ
jgi:hypothetical protein